MVVLDNVAALFVGFEIKDHWNVSGRLSGSAGEQAAKTATRASAATRNLSLRMAEIIKDEPRLGRG